MKRLIYSFLILGLGALLLPDKKEEGKSVQSQIDTKEEKIHKSSFFVPLFIVTTVFTGILYAGTKLPVKEFLDAPFQDVPIHYTGRFTIDNNEYYFIDGQVQNGFMTLENQDEIYVKEGLILKGIQEIDGKQYIFDEKTGAKLSGWMMDEEPIFLLDASSCQNETYEKNKVRYTIDTDNGEILEVLPIDIPYYSQKDEKWSKVEIGEGGPIYDTGCGPTIATSVVNYFNDTEYTPEDIARIFFDWGHYNGKWGHGSDSGVWRPFAKEFNLTFQNELDEEEMEDALRNGDILIATMGKGQFVHNFGTHIILAYGINAQNETYVYDPYRDYQNGQYPISLFMKEKAQDEMDLVDGGPFFAIGKQW